VSPPYEASPRRSTLAPFGNFVRRQAISSAQHKRNDAFGHEVQQCPGQQHEKQNSATRNPSPPRTGTPIQDERENDGDARRSSETSPKAINGLASAGTTEIENDRLGEVAAPLRNQRGALVNGCAKKCADEDDSTPKKNCGKVLTSSHVNVSGLMNNTRCFTRS
jgi:hypothetical protein